MDHRCVICETLRRMGVKNPRHVFYSDAMTREEVADMKAYEEEAKIIVDNYMSEYYSGQTPPTEFNVILSPKKSES